MLILYAFLSYHVGDVVVCLCKASAGYEQFRFICTPLQNPRMRGSWRKTDTEIEINFKIEVESEIDTLEARIDTKRQFNDESKIENEPDTWRLGLEVKLKSEVKLELKTQSHSNWNS